MEGWLCECENLMTSGDSPGVVEQVKGRQAQGSMDLTRLCCACVRESSGSYGMIQEVAALGWRRWGRGPRESETSFLHSLPHPPPTVGYIRIANVYHCVCSPASNKKCLFVPVGASSSVSFAITCTPFHTESCALAGPVLFQAPGSTFQLPRMAG